MRFAELTENDLRVPTSLDSTDLSHLQFADSIIKAYAGAIANPGEWEGLIYKPESSLPLPRSAIALALEFMSGSGGVAGGLTSLESQELLNAIRCQLPLYLDVPSLELPRDPVKNAIFGSSHSESLIDSDHERKEAEVLKALDVGDL